MARLHLFELSDQPWLPESVRSGMLGYLRLAAKLGRHGREVAKLLRVALDRSGATRIVDIGSGGGGPVVDAYRELQAERPELGLTMTDLRPDVVAMEAAVDSLPGDVQAVLEPVDATRVPREVEGVRTLFNAFHHLRPEEARAVLQNAVDARQPIVVAEMLARNPLILALNLGTGFCVPFALPFQRPFQWAWLFWGWLLPVIPLATTWDAVVSWLRIYSDAELCALVEGLDGYESYTWQLEKVRFLPSPLPGTALIGTPRRS